MSELVRLRLRTPNGVWADRVERSRIASACSICGQPIAAGEPCFTARSFLVERICLRCGESRVIEHNATRCTVLTIAWQNDLAVEDVQRLSRAWALRISEKPVVAQVHTETFGTVGS